MLDVILLPAITIDRTTTIIAYDVEPASANTIITICLKALASFSLDSPAVYLIFVFVFDLFLLVGSLQLKCSNRLQSIVFLVCASFALLFRHRMCGYASKITHFFIHSFHQSYFSVL